MIVIHTAGIVDISDEASGDAAGQRGGTKHVIRTAGNIKYKDLSMSVRTCDTGTQQICCAKGSEGIFGGSRGWGYANKRRRRRGSDGCGSFRAGRSDCTSIRDFGAVQWGEKIILVQLVNDYIRGSFRRACMEGYDFVDVRDVAWRMPAGGTKGRTGGAIYCLTGTMKSRKSR